jgi:hypothetical protein
MVRLTTSLFTNALLREVHARGGTGAVICKGDPTSGALLLLCTEKGQITGVYDYVLDPSGHYNLARLASAKIETAEKVELLCAERRRFDPDLWIVELDIPNGERFIADFTARD